MDERFFIVIQHPFEDSHRQSIEPFLSGLSSQRRILVYFLCTPKLSLGNLTPPHNFNLHSSIPLVISKSSKSSYSPHFIRVYREEDYNKKSHQKNRSLCHDDAPGEPVVVYFVSFMLFFSRNFTDSSSCKFLNPWLVEKYVCGWARVKVLLL